ncbi:MAG: Glu-tRNA(Gln) amidotransferase subunit GatE [bacterium]|nr:Glu-tRNA(Gln) amidotransferase subunit GatE [bacterium]
MTDYEALGLKCGIEIHQQIEGKKLFCNCPTLIRDDQADIVVNRRLRASAGETGEVDVAAAHEAKKEKYYIYNAYSDTTCLVELDAEPIHAMNRDALDVALQVSLLLNAKIVDSIQVMRKTVVDGSNTSGFQRTALVATNGFVETSKGKVTIPAICIEEEAAKIEQRTSECDIYNLSRLGIPLAEIGTGPDIRSPEQAKETAEKLGMILRSTGKVKRGLGTIRQDVNVSIKGGERIEIKGAQELRLIPKYVEYEVLRQKTLLEIKEQLGNVKQTEKVVDISELLKDSDSKIIKSTFAKQGVVLAVKLKGFAGFVGKEVQPGRRLGTEFSDYAKVSAGVGGIFHSDEMPAYGITEDDAKKIKKKLGCSEKDAFVMVADKKAKAVKAIEAVLLRANLTFEGIPKEVRKANPDGTTSFMRPMPGAARMYPETDCVAIMPDISKVKIPELITEKAEKYKGHGLSGELAKQLSKSNKTEFFEGLVEKYKNVDKGVIAATLLTTGKEIKKRYNLDASKLSDDDFEKVIEQLDKKSISKEAVLEILVLVAKGEKIDDSINKFKKLSDKELEAEIDKIIKANKGLPPNALIGKAMGQLRGRADGKSIVEMLKKKG